MYKRDISTNDNEKHTDNSSEEILYSWVLGEGSICGGGDDRGLAKHTFTYNNLQIHRRNSSTKTTEQNRYKFSKDRYIFSSF